MLALVVILDKMSTYFKRLSEKVQIETLMVRDSFKNSTNKGNGFEVIIRNFISTYMPTNCRVTHGEIIDTWGNDDLGQVDIAVVSDFHPNGIGDGRPNLIFYDL